MVCGRSVKARPLARSCGLLLRADLLQRVHATRAQSELDAAARRRNLRRAFDVRGDVPAHVVLVDDVMTTGASVREAAQVLHAAGAGQVGVLVLARTDEPEHA